MSVASEFPPEVHIPEQARPRSARVRHLAVVPAPQPLAVVPLRSPSPALLCAEEVSVGVSPLRLTRRGIVALVAATITAGVLLLLVAHASLAQAPANHSATSLTGETVVVQNGDTLWSIAQRAEPSADPRRVVDQLRRVNHLSSVDLSPGQTLNLR